MSSFFITAFGLAATGLGTIVYRHPILGRKIIYVIGILFAITFLIVAAYSIGHQHGFTDAESAVVSNLSKRSQVNTHPDSLVNSIKIITSVVNDIQESRQEVVDQESGILKYFFVCGIALFVLLIMSFVLAEVGNPKSKNNNEATV